ncbi:MAG: ankyrin repeat domain-containing protein [Alphaproteobacteria bacterium]|nr:ankyrin repeat domain-containing protein [Alphaproteobacteria bacterium]
MLHRACWNDYEHDWERDCKTKVKKNIKALHEAHVRFNIIDDRNGKALLHYIAEYSVPEAIGLLIEYGALTALKTRDDLMTPLHMAVLGNKVENVKFLLKYGVTGLEGVRDKWGRTALNLAARYGRTDIVKAILEHNPRLIDDKNNQGWTALHYAAYYKHENMVQYLIDNHAGLNMRTQNGKTALQYAVKTNWHDGNIIRLLVRNNKDLTGENEALEWAVMVNDKEMIKILIERGVDVNVKNEYDELVIEKARTPAIKKLIKNAAKVRADYLASQQIQPQPVATHKDNKVDDISRQYGS